MPSNIGLSINTASCGGDRCANCNAENVPLLACDENLDGKGIPASPSLRSRFCSNCMIGKNVRVFWPVNNKWYIGSVQQYDDATGEHLLQYEDGDTEWVKIGESNTTVPQPTHISVPLSSPAGGPHDGPHMMSGSGAPPPVSPATGHVIENTDSPRTHPYGVEGPQGATTVSPDDRWHHPGGPPRMGEVPPPPYARSYGAPGAGYPPPAHIHHYGGPPPYGGFHPAHGPPPGYGYPPHMVPSSLHPSQMGPESLKALDRDTSVNSKRKTGPKAWTKEEDTLLLSIVQSMRMPMKWSLVAQSLPERTGKQCRERYVNHLNPRLKVTDWSPVEDSTIFHLYNTIGSHWAKMSKIIPGRTDNGIKNRFHNLRRQLEREDEHRLRLNAARDYPEEIRLDLVREFPLELRGKAAELWDIKSGLSVLAAQSVLGAGMSRTAGRFGPFREAEPGDVCVRCGFLVPSVQTGNEVCTKTGWCQTCARIPPHVSGNMLRECLNLRRSQVQELRKVIESWEVPGVDTEKSVKKQ
ncbi:Myb-like DNA-binding protein [Nitzschia inconspicua]|uniref:Myb-like DNA-binding protein n=1 Tax=Nitzschia inconspicua TaxID=303405 RepID=A0A9K3LCZ6_9STRA|nr:Myb-like DNA-binding protein [Nitzschia inconspicua]